MYLTEQETFAKLLFPSFIAGLIIGKDGAEISSLMARTSTTVKFSPGRELYPNTQDRVCCILGTVPNIISAIRNIFQRIASADNIYDQEILKSIKMIVSNSASGIIIGKSGSTIKTIQQTCGVRIQLTNKDETKGLPERTMSITAESTENVLEAVKDVLTRVLHDSEGDKWKKVLSYTSYMPNTTANSSCSQSATDYSTLFQSMTASNNGSSISTSSSESSIAQAMISYMYSQSLTSSSSYFTRYAPVMIDGVNLSIPGSTLVTYEVAVPEVMINSVLGVGAKLLTDLMNTTGTRIQISGAGDYIPGTYNRKLTISGPILAVQSAHLAVMQNITRDIETYRKQGLV